MKKILSIFLAFVLGLAAASAHDFKIEKGKFWLDGKPVTLVCGEMHYPRIPQEYWRDRMLRAKAMGINCISTYVFWNIHERQPGVFDFKGEAPSRPIRLCGMGLRRFPLLAAKKQAHGLAQR